MLYLNPVNSGAPLTKRQYFSSAPYNTSAHGATASWPGIRQQPASLIAITRALSRQNAASSAVKLDPPPSTTTVSPGHKRGTRTTGVATAMAVIVSPLRRLGPPSHRARLSRHGRA